MKNLQYGDNGKFKWSSNRCRTTKRMFVGCRDTGPVHLDMSVDNMGKGWAATVEYSTLGQLLAIELHFRTKKEAVQWLENTGIQKALKALSKIKGE